MHNINEKKIYLITGVAGFIGFHLANKLLLEGYTVIGIDNMNDYYDVNLKKHRLNSLISKNFKFYKCDILDNKCLNDIIHKEKPSTLIHLAAQAGVRYSLENSKSYLQNNIIGFYNILESCKLNNVKQLFFASSSSVYGNTDNVPFKESNTTDLPVSVYAATKKTNELLAHSYSYLYGIQCIGLRFFTAYGPYGRPDMSYYKFMDKYMSGEPITVYYSPKPILRDFTYIDDLINCVYLLLNKNNDLMYNIYNIGSSNPIELEEFIKIIENVLSEKTKNKISFNKIKKPLEYCDVNSTFSCSDKLQNSINYSPNTSLYSGISQFIDWYFEYNNLNNNED